MRTRLPIFLPLLMTLFCAAAARAQDANKIIDEYVKASGGKKTLQKIRTLTLEGSVAGTENNGGGSHSATYTFNTKLPNRIYYELATGNSAVIEAYNGKSAWHEKSGGEIETLVGAEGQQLEAAAQIYNSHLLDLKKNKIAVAFVGHAQVNGADTLEVELTNASAIKRQIYFDARTHLIAKETATVGGVEETFVYSDYRAVDGVQLPYKIEWHRGSDVIPVAITRAVVNGNVGERVFDFPQKSQVKLPDLKALFKEIDDNQKAIDKLRENYAGTKVEEETEYESNGKAKKTDVKESTFFYLDGEEVSTLVKKDGKTLDAADQEKENEKTRKEIANLEKERVKKEAKEAKAQEQGKEDNEDLGIETFLRACQFVNPRRERFRGKEVLVFDVEPNPDFKPHKMEEKVLQKVAGVVWIDEQAHDVARIEMYFTSDFKIAGGLLANLQKGASIVFEQSFVNDEVWLPTYSELHIGLRFLLLKGVRVTNVTRYSDYKKFNVESVSHPATAPTEKAKP